MKKVGVYKFNLKHIQNGFVLLLTMFLLLIIATLTITFFYLQFLEVNLIAKETENLQSFYLAEAGLEKGRKLLLDPNTNTNILNELEKKGELKYNDRVVNSCNQKKLASNKEGIFYYEYRLNPNVPDSDITGIITITGTGWVNNDESQIGDICKKKSENRREIENRFEWSAGGLLPAASWPGKHFGPIVEKLKYPVVMSRFEPNLQEKITFISKDDHGFKDESKDQSIILLYNELSPEQQIAYNSFANSTKTDIAQARLIDKNDNELLFPEKSRDLFKSPYLEGINDATLQMLYGKNCPFVYTEGAPRETKGGRTLIVSSSMTIKSSKIVTLEGGLYFFESLTLEENSILNTNGIVQIYTKKLVLKENARLMGGKNIDYNNASPNDLVILVQYWDGTNWSREDDGVKIGPRAKVCGHIFAPNLKVRLSRGSGGKETRVHGSILTYQLVTYIDPGKQAAYGPIRIIYEEYLNEELIPILGSWREVRNQ